jgi:hypothetical protein
VFRGVDSVKRVQVFGLGFSVNCPGLLVSCVGLGFRV